jgi:diguanylate cyclase (GGDEF)-like protein
MGVFNFLKPNLETLKSKEDIKGIVNAIKSKKDENIRNKAVEALIEIGNEKAVKALIEVVNNEEEPFRQKILETFEKVANERAEEALIKVSKDSSSDIRLTAIFLLGKIKNERAVEAVIQALKDEDEVVRMKAAEILGKQKSEQAVESLIQSLRDIDWGVREKAAESLGEIKDVRAVEALIKTLNDRNTGVRLKASSSLRKIGKPAAKSLIKALKSKSEIVRAEVAEILGEIKEKEATEPLIEALKDEDWEVRKRAALALRNLGEIGVEPLIDVMESEDEEIWASRLSTFERVKELEKTAHIDTLTQVANRRLAEMTLQTKFSEMIRYNLTLGLLFIDIDHFKKINDEYGHDVGDRVLQMVAATLSENTRESDVVGRWGGEEFIVILPHTNKEELLSTAERLRKTIEGSVLDIGTKKIRVTISVGGTTARPNDTIETLVKRADQLMYQSKASGRNRVTTD